MARALIVDDSKFMRTIIRGALEEAGHEIVAEKDNGGDGIEAYKEYSPDFVTMDITMGGKDGIRAVKEILQYDSKARIVVVSALSENTIRLSDDDVNSGAFVTKPFEKETLQKAVEELING